MDVDDPRLPLLGTSPRRGTLRRAASRLCSVESWRRRLPITIWLPQYNVDRLFRDAIAGFTVGLTSIPQGIAYAIVAGLPPQVGLYSSVFPGLVYVFLGSCKDVTVGPTAILAALLAKYVAISPDFAYLGSFLTGCVIMLLGICQLGFLLDFISKPVISGFTTAAALQISASQLKSLFRTTGSSGGTFISAFVSFIQNIKTVQLWDTLLGLSSIAALYIIKAISITPSPSDGPWRSTLATACLYMGRARNALVVLAGSTLAFLLYREGETPFALTGTIHSGLPNFGPPPFSTVVGNTTLNFGDMLATYGPQGLVLPLVAILESIAIAKAFAGSSAVDCTQEMIAVGACNMVASFAQAMPATGSFTRTALNNACGVTSPAGSFFKASVVLLAVTLLAEAFYFIPRASLAAVIMVAMASLIDLVVVRTLWRHSKTELLVWILTVLVGAGVGLEYGIAAGVAADAVRILAGAARPHITVKQFKVGSRECSMVTLEGALRSAGAARLTRAVRRAAERLLVIDGTRLLSADVAVTEDLAQVLKELDAAKRRYVLWNFSPALQRALCELHPAVRRSFVAGPSIDLFILGMDFD
ncbi:sodium-independent sulfate anion transporter-like isoform X1 [Aricia agestis]|uniref:sodium-independent sulfate anion transporter-like isoform X1 n=1 Tax=Aricia agestis TaxID=91739 RepID=UPI001C2078BB|nr:sodium-independent sulfate anion transporter-like isoform X1 [Aricia agestis]